MKKSDETDLGLLTALAQDAMQGSESLGLKVQALISVQMAALAADNMQSFVRTKEFRPEITSAWTPTGEADYVLGAYCDDLAALNTLTHHVLLPNPAVARVQSQMVMEQLKSDAPLPI